MKSRIWIAVLGVLALSSVASAGVLMIPVLPVGDGYSHDELGTSYDYFTSTATVNPAYYNYWGTSDTLNRNIAYAQFGLSGIPTGVPILSVALNFYMDGKKVHSSGAAGTVMHVANAGSANGSASQKLVGGELVLTINTQPNGWVSADVTSFVVSDLSKGYSWSAYSFHAYNDWFGPFGFDVMSAESAYVPYLSVTTIPEPATLGLLAVGGLMLLRRR